MVSYRKISMFCSFNLGDGGRAGKRNGGATFINTIANTNGNANTGATVNINSAAPEAPSSAAAAQPQASCKPLGSVCVNNDTNSEKFGHEDNSICCSKNCVTITITTSRMAETKCRPAEELTSTLAPQVWNIFCI